MQVSRATRAAYKDQFYAITTFYIHDLDTLEGWVDSMPVRTHRVLLRKFQCLEPRNPDEQVWARRMFDFHHVQRSMSGASIDFVNSKVSSGKADRVQ